MPDNTKKIIPVNINDANQKNLDYLKNQVRNTLINTNVNLQNMRLRYCDNDLEYIQLEDENDFSIALQEAENNEMSKLDLYLSTISSSTFEQSIMESDIQIQDLSKIDKMSYDYSDIQRNTLQTPVFAHQEEAYDFSDSVNNSDRKIKRKALRAKTTVND